MSKFEELKPELIEQAYHRIKPYVNETPLVTSAELNGYLGHEIYFKMECLQKTNAFKFRGAINTLLRLKEENKMPDKVVAFTSGNHGQSLAHAAKLLGIKCVVVLPAYTSELKKQSARDFGAEIIETPTRPEAEVVAKEYEAKGYYLLPPFDHDYVITGQGTACYEALKLQGMKGVDAIFATCSGGGLSSGTYLAKELLSPKSLMFGVEPKMCNDAGISYRTGKIFKFDKTNMSIAEGARTLAVAERAFPYIKKFDGFYEAEESDIIYWSQWLKHLLKTPIEPTSALAMDGAIQWLREQNSPKKCMVILSGGNISPEVEEQVWKQDMLSKKPSLAGSLAA